MQSVIEEWQYRIAVLKEYSLIVVPVIANNLLPSLLNSTIQFPRPEIVPDTSLQQAHHNYCTRTVAFIVETS